MIPQDPIWDPADKHGHAVHTPRSATSECIWQIADADASPTKFIISDHPVVTYNRALPPGSDFAGEFDDPDKDGGNAYYHSR
jgi:hypothetical protein